MSGHSTIRDVARIAGVSTATVSRTLSHPDVVAKTTREAVMRAVATTGYQPNSMAVSLRRLETRTVVVLVSDIANPFYAGAVAAKHLAREDATTAGIIGAGVQAGLQLEALTLIRPITQAKVWARDGAKAGSFADTMSDRLGITVDAVSSAEAAVRETDIVVTTTPSTTPLVEKDWLSPGQHITAMGSDAEHKNELSPAVLKNADLYVCDRREQCARLGELHHALDAGMPASESVFPELGEIIVGRSAGRPSAIAITVADLTGTGVQDTAIATSAYGRAIDAGAGTTFSS